MLNLLAESRAIIVRPQIGAIVVGEHFLLVYKLQFYNFHFSVQGLNEEYEKIGMEVFNAFREDIFEQLELKVEERNEIRRNRSEWNSGWG